MTYTQYLSIINLYQYKGVCFMRNKTLMITSILSTLYFFLYPLFCFFRISPMHTLLIGNAFPEYSDKIHALIYLIDYSNIGTVLSPDNIKIYIVVTLLHFFIFLLALSLSWIGYAYRTNKLVYFSSICFLIAGIFSFCAIQIPLLFLIPITILSFLSAQNDI